MSAKWARQQVPEWKGPIPTFRFTETYDGSYNGRLVWKGKDYFSYTFNNKRVVRDTLERKRVELMRDILKGRK